MDFIHYLQALQSETHLYIQTHDFPDHDAVAAAYGLQQLLTNYKVRTQIIYAGSIERESLQTTIDKLGIKIHNNKEFEIDVFDKIIIVDGCKGNNNVTNLVGDEIAVIDHHDVATPEDVWFVDIRPQLGSCSTQIYTYYREMGVQPQLQVANALLIGLQMDTHLLTRGISSEDIDAYAYLFRYADMDEVNQILRNNLQVKDLEHLSYALQHARYDKNIAFCYFEQGCPQNLMGIIGDFFMSLKEINFVMICARNEDKVNLSIRSEVGHWHSAEIMKLLLRDKGMGGGHPHMAGGIFFRAADFNGDKVFEDLRALLYRSVQ